jgi:6-phosphogluconolactonase
MTTPQIHISPDPTALAVAVADWLFEKVHQRAGPFSLCLSGGSTPKALYRLLAEPPYRDRFPWPRIHLFWGDERFVPPDDELSNYRMVREALLDHAPIPPGNIHSVRTRGLDPQGAAAEYQQDLQAFYGAERLDPARPLFDVNLLGLGADGHTASLFPGDRALEDRTDWVAAVIGAKAEARITLTYPTLESSRAAAFLVAGADKAAILARLIQGDQSLPAARLQPAGDLLIFRDAAAGGAV